MLDLETLGLNPGCAIISIGAVLWWDDIPSGRHHFKTNISIQANIRAGLELEGEVVEWWFNRPAEVQKASFADAAKSVEHALMMLSEFAGKHCDTRNLLVWSKGTHFDNAILLAAYHKVGLTPFWGYKNNRDYRTLAAMFPGIPEPTRAGTHHDALDDAIHQANHLQAILDHMRPV